MFRVEMSNGLKVTYSYYANGLVKYAVYANGTRTHYEYDVARRLTKMTHEVTGSGLSLKVLEYDYYDNDLLKEIFEPQPSREEPPSSWEKTEFFYDNRGRLIRERRGGQDQYQAWITYDLRYTYDQVGNRLTKEDVLGHKDVTYTYDVENPELYGSCSNRLMTYFIDDEYDEEDEQVWYTYDDNGNVTRIVRQYADDDQYRSTWLFYDRGGRVSYVIGETWNADDLDWQAGGEEGCEYALSNDAYTWSDARAYAQSRGGDLAGCLGGGECDWLFSEFHPGTEDFTQYWVGGLQDELGEEPDVLWEWVFTGYEIDPEEDTWLPGAPNDGDPGENCTTSGGGPSHQECRDYDVAALVYNYDAGTLGLVHGFDDIDDETELRAIIQRDEDTGICTDGLVDYTRTFAWEFRYDGARQRYLRREVDPDDFTAISQEWSDYHDEWVYADFVLDTGVPGGAHTIRDYLGDDRFGHAHADSSTHGVWDDEAYYHTDQIGSTRLMTDGTPSVVREYVYDAFGNVYESSGSATTRYRYAGASGYQSHDDFPFLHLGARYYDPETGRFLQGDPSGIGGGLNAYAYALNNPVTFVDPEGQVPSWLKSGWAKLTAGATLLAVGPQLVYKGCVQKAADAAEAAVERLGMRSNGRKAYNIEVNLQDTKDPGARRYKGKKNQFGTFDAIGYQACFWMTVGPVEGDPKKQRLSISWIDDDGDPGQVYDPPLPVPQP